MRVGHLFLLLIFTIYYHYYYIIIFTNLFHLKLLYFKPTEEVPIKLLEIYYRMIA